MRCTTLLVAAMTMCLLAVANTQAAPVVLNSSFESSATNVGSLPAGATYTNPFGPFDLSVTDWTFGASAGDSFDGLMTAVGFSFPISGISGVAAAFVEGTGFFEQAVAGFDAATYTVSFLAQGRELPGFGPNPLQVSLGGTVLTFSGSSTLSPPTTGGLMLYTSDPVSVAAGIQTLRFEGAVPLSTQDLTTFVDDVSVVEVPEPSSMLLMLTASLCMIGFARRRRA